MFFLKMRDLLALVPQASKQTLGPKQIWDPFAFGGKAKTPLVQRKNVILWHWYPRPAKTTWPNKNCGMPLTTHDVDRGFNGVSRFLIRF